MSHLPFARKYRPSKFADLIGQDVLTKTLSMEIKELKIPQGIILSGIRGIGKTTSARIISKVVNCHNIVESNTGIEACEECPSCVAVKRGNHPDILEMDAASATGVDDVRQIIDGAEYRPLVGKFKVYIIDEVHMFSKNAFNALLKVLEEPPPHVIFILATTEINKIPVTILSRCQRFFLKRLASQDTVSLLRGICAKENIKFSDAALELIAIKSEGSARDAISMLDQASSMALDLKTRDIDIDLVSNMVGVVDTEIAVRFFLCLIKPDTDTAISILHEVNERTGSLISFIESVIDVVGYASKLKVIKGDRKSVV
jgi:DNA polymerase-3 subunit gamma/tau